MNSYRTSNLTIAPARRCDRDDILATIVGSGLFDEPGIAEIAPMLDAYLAEAGDVRDAWLAVERDGSIVAAASYAPEPITDGSWNLKLIAVRRDAHRVGIGRALLRYIEEDLAARRQRILLVETSGVATFKATRGFYRACGYHEEARIRDFYATGDDKIVFRKRLVT